jgi:hypothetical protein
MNLMLLTCFQILCNKLLGLFKEARELRHTVHIHLFQLLHTLRSFGIFTLLVSLSGDDLLIFSVFYSTCGYSSFCLNSF